MEKGRSMCRDKGMGQRKGRRDGLEMVVRRLVGIVGKGTRVHTHDFFFLSFFLSFD